MPDQVAAQDRLIAVPSMGPEGLEANRSGHFGHSPHFTLVRLAADREPEVTTVENAPHGEGGCLEPVKVLAGLGVSEIIVGGMGGKPLAFFDQMGISVYVDQELPLVSQVIEAHLSDKLPQMTAMHACGGGEGGCH